MFFKKAKRIKELEKEVEDLKLLQIKQTSYIEYLKSQEPNVVRVVATSIYPTRVMDGVVKKETLYLLMDKLSKDIDFKIESDRVSKITTASIEIVRRS